MPGETSRTSSKCVAVRASTWDSKPHSRCGWGLTVPALLCLESGAAGSELREGFVRASEGKQRNVVGALEITGALRERRSWLYRFFLGRSGSLLGSGGNW
jgi:hypothetical protein